MGAPDIKIYRNLKWGAPASAAGQVNVPVSTVPNAANRFALLQGPGGILPDAADAIWIGPNSEADAVWIHDGFHQGQPFLVSVGHPFVGALSKDVTLYQYTPWAGFIRDSISSAASGLHLLELHYVPAGQPLPTHFPMVRAPLRRFESLIAPIAGGGSVQSQLLPVMGRKRVQVTIDAADAQDTVTIQLYCIIAQDDMTAGDSKNGAMGKPPAAVVSSFTVPAASTTIDVVSESTRSQIAGADFVALDAVSSINQPAPLRIAWLATDY